jgi:hypothetical protein
LEQPKPQKCGRGRRLNAGALTSNKKELKDKKTDNITGFNKTTKEELFTTVLLSTKYSTVQGIMFSYNSDMVRIEVWFHLAFCVCLSLSAFS